MSKTILYEEAIEQLANKYGLTYHPEQVPALIAKYGLNATGRWSMT
jgi:hypothetical protein